MPKLLTLENAEMTTPGAVSKRTAFRLGGLTNWDSTSLSPEALGLHNGQLVVFAKEDYIAEYAPTFGDWAAAYPTTKMAASSSRMIYTKKTAEFSRMDCVTANNLLFVSAVENQSGTDLDDFDANVHVFDRDTDAYVTSFAVYRAESSRLYVKLAVISNTVMVFYNDSLGKIKCATINAASLTSGIGSFTNLVSDANAAREDQWDTHYSGSYAYVTYVQSDGEINYIRTLQVAADKTINDNIRKIGDASKCVAVYHHGNAAKICVAYATASNGVLFITYDEALTEEYAGTIDAAATTAHNLVIATFSTTHFTVFYEEWASAEISAKVEWRNVQISDGAVGSASFAYGVSLAHKAAEMGTNKNSVIGLYRYIDTTLASIYYSVTIYGTTGLVPIAKYQHLKAGGYCTMADAAVTSARPDRGMVPSTARLSSVKFIWATGLRTAMQAEGSTLYQNASIGRFTYNEGSGVTDVKYQNVQFANVMPIASSLPMFWDGHKLHELGFSHAPYINSLGGSITGGNLEATETYQYIAVYEFLDAHGQIWRSEPSLPSSVTLGANDDSVEVEVKSPVHHQDLLNEMAAVVGIYRTVKASGGPFYRVNSHEFTDADLLGYCNADTYDCVDTVADTTLTGNELLYTTGGVLGNFAPPPTEVFAVHQRRLWAVHSETGELWPSKEFVEGEGVGFNPGLAISTDLPLQIPTALVSMETALVVFWENSIGIVYGDGSNDRGEGGTYTRPYMKPGDIGCIDRRSVVKTPVGIMFQARQGIYLLGNDLGTPQYIGMDVAAYDGNTIYSADLMERKHQARFIYASGGQPNMLVYNYLLKQWHVWTTSLGTALPTDAIVRDTLYYFVASDKLWYHSTSSYVDEKSDTTLNYYSTTIKTSWIKLAGLQGFNRVWRGFILGEYKDTHDVKVSVKYDYRDSMTAYEHDYSDDDINSLDPFQLKVPLTIQRCESIQFQIDLITSGEEADSEASTITGLRFEYGIKGRSMRLPADASAGGAQPS
jgi:hypothetical protein